LDKDTGYRKLVARVNDDGSPINLNVRNMVPNDYVNFIDLNNIKYTYTDIGGATVNPSDVNVRGIYTVKIEFPTKSTDHVANPIYVELELKDVTKVFVEWTSADHYYFNGKVQHPTATLKDADGGEILAKDWEYEFVSGDGIKVMRGHNIIVNLLNDAYEFDASTTTYCIFEIERALLEAPTVREKIEYAGTYVNLADYLDGYDADLMEIVSGGREMEVDSYTAIVKIRDDVKANCQWTNNASTQMINWSIEKRTLTAIWSKSTFILADVGSGVNPKVVNFVGMYDDDLNHFNFDTDLLYSGDLAKTEQGVYKISV
ncbi:MAG: hypothetical protein K2N18_05090, partial [Clostridia bacterium]|nr:hypothetical protein [Clostridia bacterium]